MEFNLKTFAAGVVVGAVAAHLIKTPAFKRGVSRIVSGALQLKDDAKEYFDTIKEDAEDEAAAREASATPAS